MKNPYHTEDEIRKWVQTYQPWISQNHIEKAVKHYMELDCELLPHGYVSIKSDSWIKILHVNDRREN